MPGCRITGLVKYLAAPLPPVAEVSPDTITTALALPPRVLFGSVIVIVGVVM